MITIPKIEVKITTLTPIWTGNHDRKMDGVKETGILGSLRWWYEAILRGFGCDVCDPTEKKCKCDYDYKHAELTGIASDGFRDEKSNACVCTACQIFGCTGWSKQFRMRWEDKGEHFQLKNPDQTKGEKTYKHDKYNNQGHYICSREPGKEGGECQAIFYPQNQRVGQILTYLLQFASHWGGFGARPQFGYGICKAELLGTKYTPKIEKPTIYSIKPKPVEFPDLRDFFFCEFEPKFEQPNPTKTNKYDVDSKNYFTIETKYQIRQALRGFSSRIRHFICGEVQGEDKTSSKICISRPHNNNCMLIRGYVPNACNIEEYNREQILQRIFDTLGSTLAGIKHVWIEFDPVGTNRRNTKTVLYKGSTAEDKYMEWLQYLIQ